MMIHGGPCKILQSVVQSVAANRAVFSVLSEAPGSHALSYHGQGPLRTYGPLGLNNV